jgi:hypothetical protein
MSQEIVLFITTLLEPQNLNITTVEKFVVIQLATFFVLRYLLGTKGSRDRAVSIATGYGLDGPRGRNLSSGKGKVFLLSTSSRPVLGPTQPSIQWVPGALSPGVKRPGHEADHSPPTSVEVKKTWIYTSTWRNA